MNVGRALDSSVVVLFEKWWWCSVCNV